MDYGPPRLDQLLTCHSGSIGDEVYYRSTRLMLQLVFFVSVFCVHGCLRSIFAVLGLLRMFLEHPDLVFLSYPSSGLEFFFFGLTPRYHDSCGSRRESSPF